MFNKKTAWEKLQGRIESERLKLEQAGQRQEELKVVIADNYINDKDVNNDIRQFSRLNAQINDSKEILKALEQEQSKHKADHITSQIEKLKAEIDELNKRFAPVDERYQKAHEEFYEQEAEWQSLSTTTSHKVWALWDKINQLENELEKITEGNENE